jgi:peptide/nickel transport system substrate-binding protein
MIKWRTLVATGWLIGSALAPSEGVATAPTLRIGLADDPGVLDPTQGRTYVGRIVPSAGYRRVRC